MMVCRENDSLGAYLLGALDPAERESVERHVAGCTRCQSELVELAPLLGMLRHATFDELPETPATALTRHPAKAASNRTATTAVGPSSGGGRTLSAEGARHHLPRRVLAAIAVTVAALGAGAGIYLGAFASGPGHPPLTLSATSPVTHISAVVTLTPDQSGTAVQLKLTGLPPAVICHLVVHATDGRSETAATWASGYSTAVTVPASTSIGPQDISQMDVLDASGRLLVELPQT